MVVLTVLCSSLPTLARQQDDGIEDYPQVQQLTGPALVTGATAITNFTRGFEASTSIRNIISLKLKEETPIFISDQF